MTHYERIEKVGKMFRKWWKVKTPYFNVNRYELTGRWTYTYPEDFPFSILPRFKQFVSPWTLFTRKDGGLIMEWWWEACAKARDDGKKPMLVLGVVQYGYYVIVDEFDLRDGKFTSIEINNPLANLIVAQFKSLAEIRPDEVFYLKEKDEN